MKPPSPQRQDQAAAAASAPASSVFASSSSRSLDQFMSNIVFLAPLIVVCSLAVATLFYTTYNDWPLSLSFFYSTQALFGCMYGVPTDNRALSQVFTLFLYLYGATLCSGAIGAFASHLISHASLVSRDERKRLRLQSTADQQSSLTANEFFHRQTLFHDSMKHAALVAAVAWLVLGSVGLNLLSGVSLPSALFFSLGAVTAAGTPSPLCASSTDGIDCVLGAGQSVLLACYIMIGVPLFTFTFGQFALAIVERAIRADERKILERPLTHAEFQLLRSLHDPTSTESTNDSQFDLTLSDFVVLELIRLQKIDEEDLTSIKFLFDKIKHSSESDVDRLPAPSANSKTDTKSAQTREYAALATRDINTLGAIGAVGAETETAMSTPAKNRTISVSNLSAGLEAFNLAVLPPTPSTANLLLLAPLAEGEPGDEEAIAGGALWRAALNFREGSGEEKDALLRKKKQDDV